MVGYAEDHSPDTYRIYNPETNRVILTRDVRWAEWKDTDPTEMMEIFQREPATRTGQQPVLISTTKRSLLPHRLLMWYHRTTMIPACRMKQGG